jgi:glucose/arabinose dehydrogenase
MIRLSILFVLTLIPSVARAAQPGRDSPPDLPTQPATRPVGFLSAEDAIKTMKLPKGLRVEVVACEPMVQHPVAMAFDADGRMWVAEMRSYMPDYEGNGEKQPLGRISILEDTDGDGRADKSTIFMDKLVLPRAICPVRDGALVAVPPKLLFVRDTNGDGRADQQTVLAEDYGIRGNPEHQPNGLMPAMDNWIYNAGYDKRLRFIDGKWVLDVVPDLGQWGITQDDWGRLYFNNNSDQLRGAMISPHYANRNPRYRAESVNWQIVKDQSSWPAHDTAFNRGYMKNMRREDGTLARVTAACGPVIYRGTLFPKEYWGNAFVCEPTGNLIKRQHPHREGCDRQRAQCLRAGGVSHRPPMSGFAP